MDGTVWIPWLAAVDWFFFWLKNMVRHIIGSCSDIVAWSRWSYKSWLLRLLLFLVHFSSRKAKWLLTTVANSDATGNERRSRSPRSHAKHSLSRNQKGSWLHWLLHWSLWSHVNLDFDAYKLIAKLGSFIAANEVHDSLLKSDLAQIDYWLSFNLIRFYIICINLL